VEAVAIYPNRADLFRNPELEPEDVRQALAFAAPLKHPQPDRNLPRWYQTAQALGSENDLGTTPYGRGSVNT
jgi:hypothetical protein